MALSGKQRDIEPITAISVVIFLLAAVAVGSLSVYNNYFADDDGSVIGPGSEVSVDYTGSLFDYFDKDGALIFDTNVEAHTGDGYHIIGGFNKTTFKELTFVQGDGKVLKGFENAVLGKKVGETVRVMIPANSDAYQSENRLMHNALTVSKVTYMEMEEFENIYEDVKVIEGADKVSFTTVYGWDATAAYDSVKKMVKIDNLAEEGFYKLSSDEDQSGKVMLEVLDTSGDEIICSMFVEPEDSEKGYMLWVDLGYESFYVFGEEEENLKVTSNPAYEDDIYFVITIKSIS